MHEIFEHTADFGIRAKAESLEELFAEAARGLFSLMMGDLNTVRPLEQATFHIDGDDLEGLLHDWLAELLYTFSARRVAFADFRVQIDGTPPARSKLSATAYGEPLDSSRHEIDVEAKAITWHALHVEQTADGWMAEVIVDV